MTKFVIIFCTKYSESYDKFSITRQKILIENKIIIKQKFLKHFLFVKMLEVYKKNVILIY